jgi:hypothetical protein
MAFNRPIATTSASTANLDDLKLASYRSHLGIVLQDNFLFDGTVAENIRYGKPHASMDEVKEAARIAYCDEFVEEFADKYDTVVGERGVRLSGGQRQRVAIARAILADPRIRSPERRRASTASEHKIQDACARRAAHHARDRAPAVDDPQRRPIRARSGEVVERGPTPSWLGARGTTIASALGAIASSSRATISPTRPGGRSSPVGPASRPTRPGVRAQKATGDHEWDGAVARTGAARAASTPPSWIPSPRSSRPSPHTISSPRRRTERAEPRGPAGVVIRRRRVQDIVVESNAVPAAWSYIAVGSRRNRPARLAGHHAVLRV